MPKIKIWAAREWKDVAELETKKVKEKIHVRIYVPLNHEQNMANIDAGRWKWQGN